MYREETVDCLVNVTDRLTCIPLPQLQNSYPPNKIDVENHCLVDYGLAKPYIDFETKKHISYSENRSITGKVLIAENTYKQILQKARVSTSRNSEAQNPRKEKRTQ